MTLAIIRMLRIKYIFEGYLVLKLIEKRGLGDALTKSISSSSHPPRRNVKKRFQSIVFLPMDSPFTTLHKIKDPQETLGVFYFIYWRRGRDSNPRYRFKSIQLLSRKPLSATQPPLQRKLENHYKKCISAFQA